MRKSQRRLLFILMAVSLLAFLPPEASAQKMRDKIKGFILDKIDDKALQQEVKSSLHKFTHDGFERSYYLYTPTSWNKKTPLPVVFLFHGGGGGGRGALYYYELEPKAEQEGFLLVAPNGTGENEHVLLTWNVEFGFGYAQKNKINDTGFVNALLDDLMTRFPIDEKRIFATGLSNGAIFCHFLAAQPGNRFAAIAPVVGTVGGRDPDEKNFHMPPKPQTPVSVLILQGLIDKSVPIEGGLQKKSIADPKVMMSASDTIDFWVQANGCNTSLIPVIDKQKNATLHHFSGGKAGTEVSAWVIHDMGHAWPGSKRVPRQKWSDKPSPTFPGNDIIWEFFKAHPRP